MAFVSLALFPVMFIWVSLSKTNNMIESTSQILISSKHKLVNLDSILYIYSDKNYVVWICKIDNEIVEFKARETLTSVVTRLKNVDEIIQCHRAFLINKSQISGIKKLAHTYQIELIDSNQTIPMGKKFKEKFV